MEYKGITIYSEPRKGSVKRVQNLRTEWYLKNLPLQDVKPGTKISDAIKEVLEASPELNTSVALFHMDLADVEPIMMATTLTYGEVVALEDQLSEKEYGELLNLCKDALGGGVEDFSKESGSNMSSKNRSQMEKNTSLKSRARRGGSSGEPTAHSRDTKTSCQS